MIFKLKQQLALLIVVLAVLSCGSPRNMEIERRNIDIEFRDGDIAFRRGMGFMSQAVVTANPRGSYSHVGLIFKVNDKWCVIHEVPYEGRSVADDKIYCEEIGDFYNTHKAIVGAIYRLCGADSTQLSAVREYALEQLKRSTPFDHDYNLDDDSAQYCSELVWRSYLASDIDITKGNRTYHSLPGIPKCHISPSDIEYNDDLNLVYQF